jgi:hypothetical protein
VSAGPVRVAPLSTPQDRGLTQDARSNRVGLIVGSDLNIELVGGWWYRDNDRETISEEGWGIRRTFIAGLHRGGGGAVRSVRV